jgi:arylsulfatase A-like enzyme
MKTDRYRYTEWTDKENKIYARMLYDHKADPWENVNISESPENAALVNDLQRKLHAHIKWRNAHLPSPAERSKP